MAQAASKLDAGRQQAKYQVHEQRTNILDAAERLFLQKSLENTTMVDIATQAGITKVTLYRCFPNRDAIALEIQARTMSEITSLVDLDDRDIPLESAKELARAMIRNFDRLRDAYRYMGMFDKHYLDTPSDTALAQ